MKDIIVRPKLHFSVIKGVAHIVLTEETDDDFALLGNSCMERVAWDSVSFVRPPKVPLCPVCVEKLIHMYFDTGTMINPYDMTCYKSLLEQETKGENK